MFFHFSPGHHGDRLHTCGAADAHLCAAPHHYVLPRKVCNMVDKLVNTDKTASLLLSA